MNRKDWLRMYDRCVVAQKDPKFTTLGFVEKEVDRALRRQRRRRDARVIREKRSAK